MEKEKNIHDGHRIRLREKVEKFGLLELSDHEVLEFLLTYTIPRKDTNEIAHRLLNKFSTIANVINADSNSLKTIKGIGEQSALFLKSLGEFVQVYNKSKGKERIWILKNSINAIDYFRAHFEVKGKEKFYILSLSKGGRVLGFDEIEGYDDTEIGLKTNQIAKQISVEGTNMIYIFHTHPGGSVRPSSADIETTRRILNICGAMGIRFLDHIIFNEREEYSFKSEYNLDRMYENSVNMFKKVDKN